VAARRRRDTCSISSTFAQRHGVVRVRSWVGRSAALHRVSRARVDLALRHLFALVLLVGRSDRSKSLEILVWRHELAVLRRQSGRPRIELADRALLAAMSRALPRRAWAAFSVRPETLLRCHRGLVARR
jgi:hypothetical protein